MLFVNVFSTSLSGQGAVGSYVYQWYINNEPSYFQAGKRFRIRINSPDNENGNLSDIRDIVHHTDKNGIGRLLNEPSGTSL